MWNKNRLTRITFALAALIAAAALVLHVATWQVGRTNWPAFFNMLGLLVLTAIGALDPPPGRVRTLLTVVALVMILPSAVLIVLYR